MGYAISNNYFSFMEKKKKTFIGYFITGMSDDEFSIYY